MNINSRRSSFSLTFRIDPVEPQTFSIEKLGELSAIPTYFIANINVIAAK